MAPQIDELNSAVNITRDAFHLHFIISASRSCKQIKSHCTNEPIQYYNSIQFEQDVVMLKLQIL